MPSSVDVLLISSSPVWSRTPHCLVLRCDVPLKAIFTTTSQSCLSDSICCLLQVQEREPFICELLNTLRETIHDLQPHQIHTFYESVGLMIGTEGEAAKRDDYLVSTCRVCLDH